MMGASKEKHTHAQVLLKLYASGTVIAFARPLGAL